MTRRQFLTGTFRERDIALSGTSALTGARIPEEAATPALPRDLSPESLGEHYRFGWQEESRISRDFAAPKTTTQASGRDDGIERVLEEMEDLKGIEDF